MKNLKKKNIKINLLNVSVENQLNEVNIDAN